MKPAWLRKVLNKLFLVSDTPHKIALGLGIGVFSGILPGIGPLAAIFLALVLRANRAAAIIGAVLTNTWLSIGIFLLSIKFGSAIIGSSWPIVKKDWQDLLTNFSWNKLFTLPVLKIILPVMIGYAALAFCLGLLAYAFCRLAIKIKNRNKS